jgi:hypothetical protein
MAEQSFSAAEREAIWRAHAGKCAYTRELLDISSFHIDHVLPESLGEDAAGFAEIAKKLGLADGFDLRGWENLLPCRPGANLQKAANIFADPHTHFFLGIAAAKRQDVLDRLAVIERRKNRGRAIILLQQCLERGELSAQEVAEILQKYAEAPEAIFQLVEGMKFADSDEVKAVARDEIEALRDRPIRFGENAGIDGVTLTNDANEERFVRTCREYDEAIAAGFYALTNFDIKMSSWFEHQCGLLSALQSATPPATSFLARPRVGVLDLQLIPYSFFPQVAEHEGGEEIASTYQDKVDDGSMVIKRVAPNLLQIVEPGGMGQQLIEVARADFNGDGIEDMLLFEYCYATEGTLGYGRIRIITRTSETGMFEPVSAAPN